MRIDVLTLFPEVFPGPLGASIVGRAFSQGLASLATWNFRDDATDRHHTVDDAPYGGGPGMVLKPEPLFACLERVWQAAPRGERTSVILLTPQGERLDHGLVLDLARLDRLVLLSGHYEGFDERVRLGLADREISIGDYVLTGGELPAMVLIEAVVRQLPGVLGSAASLASESHAFDGLEYPQYTRPPLFREMSVPEVLLSGNHAAIAAWRAEQAKQRTARRRPDLAAGSARQPTYNRETS